MVIELKQERIEIFFTCATNNDHEINWHQAEISVFYWCLTTRNIQRHCFIRTT